MKLESKDNALLLSVKVVPNSSRTQLAGILGDALKIKVAQPPEDGKANRAVETLLAEVVGLPPSAVTVVAGLSRPHKTVRLVGLPEDLVRARLDAALSPK